MKPNRFSGKLPLQVEVEGQQLVIRIGFDILKFVAEHCPRFYDAENGHHDGPYVTVENRTALAEDVILELTREQEDGTTPLHVLFDDAIEKAHDNGSLAFAEEESRP